MLNNKLFKQTNVGEWWGAFRNLGSYVGFYITIANIFFTLVNTYIIGNVAGVHMALPTWAIVLIAGAGFLLLLIVAMIFEHKYTLPSFMTYWNQQWWSHNNPLPNELKTMQAQLDRIERALNTTSDITATKQHNEDINKSFSKERV
jgi:hypothetical protein